MESSVFKLLIYAITALALIWIFVAFFGPSFQISTNPDIELNDLLRGAESRLGDFTENEIVFQTETGYNAEIFDNDSRSIIFECNDLGICCAKKEKCLKNIEWDERFVLFKETISTKTFARCSFNEIFICKIFFGVKPAQLKLELGEVEKEIDLDVSNKLTVPVKISNIGEKYLLKSDLTAKIYESQSNEWKTIDIYEFEPYSLDAGAETQLNLDIKINSSGKLKIEIIAQDALDITNFNIQEIFINSQGDVLENTCKLNKMNAIEEDGKCRLIYSCSDCLFGWQCIESWEKEAGINKLEVSGTNSGYKIMEMPASGNCKDYE